MEFDALGIALVAGLALGCLYAAVRALWRIEDELKAIRARLDTKGK